MIRWGEFLMPYETAVEELKNKFKGLRNEFRKNNEYSPIEFVVGRVKQVPSIIEKAKNLGLEEDEIDKLDDIGGIRIICQFEDDIYKIVDMIKAREGMDLEIVLEKDYVKEVKESGYRSYHMIVRYPIFTISGLKFVFLEIQIRTMAMNFWATVEHSLKYKYKEGIPPEIVEKLKSTAHEVYKLDKEMQEIRDEIISAQTLFMHKSNVTSQILKNISDLEKMGKRDEAINFRKRFDKINIDRRTDLEEKMETLSFEVKNACSLQRETLSQEFERMEGSKATNV